MELRSISAFSARQFLRRVILCNYSSTPPWSTGIRLTEPDNLNMKNIKAAPKEFCGKAYLTITASYLRSTSTSPIPHRSRRQANKCGTTLPGQRKAEDLKTFQRSMMPRPWLRYAWQASSGWTSLGSSTRNRMVHSNLHPRRRVPRRSSNSGPPRSDIQRLPNPPKS